MNDSKVNINNSNSYKNDKAKQKYTCNEYREEMILAALRQRLSNDNLSEDEKDIIIKEIEKIEHDMGF